MVTESTIAKACRWYKKQRTTRGVALRLVQQSAADPVDAFLAAKAGAILARPWKPSPVRWLKV